MASSPRRRQPRFICEAAKEGTWKFPRFQDDKFNVFKQNESIHQSIREIEAKAISERRARPIRQQPNLTTSIETPAVNKTVKAFKKLLSREKTGQEIEDICEMVNSLQDHDKMKENQKNDRYEKELAIDL